MKRRLLAVMPPSTNYLDCYHVEIAHSFEEAKEMIISAELHSNPYDDLDLPVFNEKQFWLFVEWMEETQKIAQGTVNAKIIGSAYSSRS